jgi:hypothetical protein
VSVLVDAPIAEVFAAATDWSAQREWVAMTKVAVIRGDGRSVGSRIEAVTGRRRVGLTDVFDITVWEPPHRVVVLHIGRLVRGPAAFSFEQLPGGRTRFVWAEWLHLPLGRLGRLGWPVVRPVVRVGFGASMRSFARFAEARSGVDR